MSDLHVIFGTGPVGRALMDELVAGGHRVRMINRSGAGSLPAGVELVAGDAADRRFSREACVGASVVYQCLNAPYHRWPEMFPRMQAGVIEGAAAAEAKLISLENLYMYGSPFGKPLSERRPITPLSRKGKVRAQMAEMLLDAHAKGRVRVAIGRASDFFGPRVLESALGARVFGAAVRGETVNVVGNTTLPHTYSYVPDVARGLVVLGERDEALGEVWHLPSPDTVTTREILAMIFAEAGRPPKVRRARKPMLRALGLVDPQIRELIEMMYLFDEPFVVDHSKFTDAFADISTPLTEAVRTTVSWFRDDAEMTANGEGVAEATDQKSIE